MNYNKTLIQTTFIIPLIFFQSHHSIAQDVNFQVPELAGEFIHIFDPNDKHSDEDTTWYTNDHCFIKDKDGTWHAYGIIGHKPIDPWKGETRFFHISARSVTQNKWDEHNYVLTAKPGVERVLWAPHVIEDEGLFYMFYNIGNMQEKRLFLCLMGAIVPGHKQRPF
ncbi:MAG: hypothetical protein AB2L24_14425 [Mangrovibacterium sp.]